ncbi:MAG: glycosyltransferase family 2 protein [Burkholderiaceae bacterium]
MADLTVIILAYNEAKHIARSIKSAQQFARQIIVVDSFSVDGTDAIARDLGAEVVQNKFINYAKQFQWALDNCEVRHDWVMRLDADETIEQDLAQRINESLHTLPLSVTGVSFHRKHIFMGRWIRYGGRYPLTLLRVWRRGMATIEDRWMDEHMVLSSGTSVVFEGGFCDNNLNDLTFFTDKHNKYATREAIDVILSKRGIEFQQVVTQGGSPRQAVLKRYLKDRVFNRLPFYLGPLFYFLYRFIIQRGFLDGKEGVVYHFLQGFWYRFLVGAKIFELESQLDPKDGDVEYLAKLSRLTGHDLSKVGVAK